MYKGSDLSTFLPTLIVHVFYYSHPSECWVVFIIALICMKFLKNFERKVPTFHSTLDSANNVAGSTWNKIMIKGSTSTQEPQSLLVFPRDKGLECGRGRRNPPVPDIPVRHCAKAGRSPSEGNYAPKPPNLPDPLKSSLLLPHQLEFLQGRENQAFHYSFNSRLLFACQVWSSMLGVPRWDVLSPRILKAGKRLEFKGLVDLPQSLKFICIKLTFRVLIDKHNCLKTSFWWRRRKKRGGGNLLGGDRKWNVENQRTLKYFINLRKSGPVCLHLSKTESHSAQRCFCLASA